MIQSFAVKLPPDENNAMYLVIDTVMNHKHVFTACGVGRPERGEMLLTQVAQSTLNALMRYADTEKLGKVHLVDIATEAAAPTRVRKVLEAANQKDVVFFICRSDRVYDAAIQALCVDMRPLAGGTEQ